jgi:peptide/nickel transport system substrate-binding protein
VTAAIAAVAALGLLVSACSGKSADQSAPHSGGSLVLGGLGDIDFMDPTAGYNTDTHTEERAWTRQLFSYPASADPKIVQSPVADVASELPTDANGGISNNGSTYTIHLRDDVM